MPAPAIIPDVLARGPFTTAMAIAAGLPVESLRGSRFRRLFRGVYVVADLVLTHTMWLHAAQLVLPPDALVSHTSAMRLYGFEPRRHRDSLEFSTNASLVTRHSQIRLHRRLGRLTPYEVEGMVVTGPDRTFVDCATRLSFVELVQLGEWLLHTKATTIEALVAYAHARHLDGVRRARRVLKHVREGVESPRETLLRLMIVFARLPEPECNCDIFTHDGRFVARGDLPYLQFKVLVEYDGWQHERDARQRQRDRERREDLEAHGWRVIVATDEDLRHPRSVPWRVYTALKARGYDGRAPLMNETWMRWFAHAHRM